MYFSIKFREVIPGKWKSSDWKGSMLDKLLLPFKNKNFIQNFLELYGLAVLLT